MTDLSYDYALIAYAAFDKDHLSGDLRDSSNLSNINIIT